MLFKKLVFILIFMLYCGVVFAAEGFSVEGVSRPSYNAQLSFAVPGTVFEIHVNQGDTVKAGDLLMNLDTRAEDSRLALLDAEIENTIKLRTLRSRAEQAKLDMQRFQAAHKANAATAMEKQHAEMAYQLSILAIEEEEFRVEQLQTSRKELLAQRERMRIYAPQDGFVEEVYIERGMAVDKNNPALRLVTIDPLYVDLMVAVEKAVSLQDGMTVKVQQPDGGQMVEGVVTQIGKIAVLSSNTIKVRISVNNPDKKPAGRMITVFF